MIRLLLAAIAIVLYLVLTFPVLCFLEKKPEKEPGGGRLEELFHGAVDF